MPLTRRGRGRPRPRAQAAEDGGAGRQAGDAADPLQSGEHGDAHQDGHPHRDKARSGPGNAPRV